MQANVIKEKYVRVKESKAVRTINAFLSSPWGMAFFGVLTLVAYMFALEFYLWTFVVLTAIYVALFGEDFLPIMPFFMLCYVSPSLNNNPAKMENSIFLSGMDGIFIISIGGLAFAFFIARILLDKNMGLKKLFTMKREQALGFLVLGGAFLLSGIGSPKYLETFWKNILVAVIEFLGFFFLYFFFSATVNWEKVKKEYFFWIGLIVALVVVGEVAHLYCTNNVLVDGSIKRGNIWTGWGTYNNVACVIVLGIPCAIYLSLNRKCGYVFILLSAILLSATFATGSRTACLIALLVFFAGHIVAFVCNKDKRQYIPLAVLVVVGAGIGLCFFQEELTQLFAKIPHIIKPSVDGGVDWNDSNRINMYKKGWEYFLQYPIFGDSFYPSGWAPELPWHVESFESNFPPRWHNTVIQMLASCGGVGFFAYAFHRFQTVKTLLKRKNITTTFIAITVLSLLAMSMLDCHLFNVGPTLFYSLALAFIEFLPKERKEKVEKN